jgi:TPR repeat protein
MLVVTAGPRTGKIAQRWFLAAAELGHGHAQMMLGRYLINGAAGDLTQLAQNRHPAPDKSMA